VLKLNPSGAPDATFGASGQASAASRLPTDDSIQTMARTADGRIVVASSGYSPILARYLASGALDPSFGQGGYVVVPQGTLGAGIWRIAVDGSGRVLAIASGDYDGYLVRFTVRGALDTSFGEGGVARLDFPASRILPLEGGKLLIAGARFEDRASVQRLNADGSVDRAFGDHGTVAMPNFDSADELLRQSDGKIIVVGTFLFEQGGQRYFGATRLRPDGRVDASFGDGGTSKIGFTDYRGASPTGAAIAPDGKIVITGPNEYYSTSDFAVARLTKDGKPDPTFGDNGVVVTDFPPDFVYDFGIDTEVPRGIVVEPDGKVVVAGVADVAPLKPWTDRPPQATHAAIALARYSPDGTLDNTFGDGGRVVTRVRLDAAANAMLLLPGHRVLVGGYGQSDRGDADFVLAQYQLDDPAPISAQVKQNVLRISGSQRGDVIRLRRENGRILISGVAGSFDPATFSGVVIDGNAGDDVIDASIASVPVTVNGGDGNDVIYGGAKADALSGGNGNDTIFGGGGSDTLHGNNGNDYLSGGAGADNLYGDAGNDQLLALDGAIDTLDGGAGFDRVKRDGNDLLQNFESLLV
jgi:uncharacterized delta-60 repeat protein